jgi:hypothetical protein
LQNIEWAIENEYPAEKIQKLFERREKAQKLLDIELANRDPSETVDNFFKLSYPANPKIPFIIDGLEVRMTEKFGRGIFTTRNLKPGDIISIEEPVLTKLKSIGRYSHCCNCLTSNKFNLIPCLNTASLMFCSKECRDVMSEITKDENHATFLCTDDIVSRLMVILETFLDAFGGPEKLLKFVTKNDIKNWNKTIFDYDLSDPNDPEYKKNLLKSILSFYSPDAYEDIRKTLTQEVDEILDEIDENVETFRNLNSFIEHIGIVFENNAMHIDNRLYIPLMNEDFIPELKHRRENEIEDIQFHPFSPLINYSCFPNIEKLTYNGRVAHYVVRPIKVGEELFRNPM